MHALKQSLFEHAFQKQAISAQMALKLINAFREGAPEILLDLFAAARMLASNSGTSHFSCAIINAKSGRCRDNCSFCAQSQHHQTTTPVYPLVPLETLVRQAEDYASNNIDYMGIVTSGTGPTRRDFEQLCETARFITARIDIRLCASFGILTPERAKALSDAGFYSYHHNLETSASFYPSICSTHDYSLRVETVKYAKAAGLRVCSGGIFGLGECWAQRIELAETLQSLNVDSIPINFLMPISGTPLENQTKLPPEEALAIIALIRLMHPGRDLVICGGRNSVLEEWDKLIFSAGANGMMIGNYLTEKGTALQKDLNMLKTLGLRV